MRGVLEALLVRYVRARDLSDLQYAFLRFWGLLETITISPSVDTISQRTSAIYTPKHQDYVREELRMLGLMRNNHIHGGVELENIENRLYALKRHVDNVLDVLLNVNFRFTTLQAFGRFLELAGRGDLKRDKQLLLAVNKFKFGS